MYSATYEAGTFQVNEHVCACVVLLEDTEPSAKLSIADMVASEAKYHTKCLLGFDDRAQEAKANRCKGTNEMEIISRIVFVELVLCYKNYAIVCTFKWKPLGRWSGTVENAW